MVLELHIWGPAFGLPSLDPQCLAAIAYLSLAIPKPHGSESHGGGEWVVIADSDPLMVPTRMCAYFTLVDKGGGATRANMAM